MALVVENTFTAIPSMAQLMFPGASHFPLFCFKNKVSIYCTVCLFSPVCSLFLLFPRQFLSNREMRRVRAPSLFLSGLSDQLIPSRMMMELYQVS